jgi:quercetin dioxygenase-like cupin family protein
MFKLKSVVLCLCCCVSACYKAGQPGAPPASAIAAPEKGQALSEIRRTLLVQKELVAQPGWESRLYLVEYPAGAQAPLHVHPVPCVGYVLEGRFESAFGQAPPTVTREGEAFVDLADEPHRLFRNPDPSRPLRFVIAGTFRKEDPLFKLSP